VASQNQLSTGGAFAMGSLFVACGIVPILFGVHVIEPGPTTGPPPPDWVPIAAGLMFVGGGLAIVLDYGIARGVGPDGDLVPGTPSWIRVANYVLGLGIIGLMAALFGWVAFGSGPRAFSSTISLPFIGPRSWTSGELSGRIMFGAADMLIWMMLLACGVMGLKRLRAAHR
jgi:hypothetical protein